MEDESAAKGPEAMATLLTSTLGYALPTMDVSNSATPVNAPPPLCSNREGGPKCPSYAPPPTSTEALSCSNRKIDHPCTPSNPAPTGPESTKPPEPSPPNAPTDTSSLSLTISTSASIASTSFSQAPTNVETTARTSTDTGTSISATPSTVVDPVSSLTSNHPSLVPSVMGNPKTQVVPIAITSSFVGLAIVGFLLYYFVYKRKGKSRRGKSHFGSNTSEGSAVQSEGGTAYWTPGVKRSMEGNRSTITSETGSGVGMSSPGFRTNERRWTNSGYREYRRGSEVGST